MRGRLLFDRIVSESGVSPLLAPGMITRALRDVGASPETAARVDYERALPRLEARLKAYLSETEVSQRLLAMRRVLEASTEGS